MEKNRTVSQYFYDSSFAFMINDKLVCNSAVKIVDSEEEINALEAANDDKNMFNRLINAFDMFYLKIRDRFCVLLFNVYVSRDLSTYYIRLDDIPNIKLKIDGKEIPKVPGTLRASKTMADIRKYMKNTLLPGLKEYFKGSENELKDKGEDGLEEDNWMMGFIKNSDFQEYLTPIQAPFKPYRIILDAYDYGRLDEESRELLTLPPSESNVAYDIDMAIWKDSKDNKHNVIIYNDYIWHATEVDLIEVFKEDYRRNDKDADGTWYLVKREE